MKYSVTLLSCSLATFMVGFGYFIVERMPKHYEEITSSFESAQYKEYE